MWRRIKTRKFFGIILTFVGGIILILSMPMWIWRMSLGVFMMLLGGMLYNMNR